MAGTPGSIEGVRDVLGINQARRVVDMAPKMIMLEDDKKAMTTFLTKLGVRKVTNHRFDWLVDEIPPKTHTIGAGGLAAVGARPAGSVGGVIVDLSGRSLNIYVRPKEILRVHETGEQMEILRVGADMTDVEVAEDIGGNVGAGNGAVAAGGPVTRTSDAHEENSTLRLPAADSTGTLVTPVTSSDILNSVTTIAGDSAGNSTGTASGGINPTFGGADWNYTQTFREPVGVSRRVMDAKMHGGKERPHQRMKALLTHCEKIENAIWHQIRGTRVSDPSATITGGMLWAINNLAQAPGSQTFDLAGAALGEDLFNEFLRTYSRYGNTQRKAFFASRWVCDVLSRFLRDGASTYRLNEDNDSTGGGGFHMTSYTSGVGFRVDIIPTNALEGIPGDLPDLAPFTGTVPSTWDGYGALLDLENVKLAKYGDTYMKLGIDVQLPGTDGVVDVYDSDVGIQFGNLNHHGLLQNIGR